MASRDEIFVHVQKAMTDLFEIDPSRITREMRVIDDLDLDSIDAIELGVHMESLTGRRIDPERFHEMRTVGDVVEIVYDIMNKVPS